MPKRQLDSDSYKNIKNVWCGMGCVVRVRVRLCSVVCVGVLVVLFMCVCVYGFPSVELFCYEISIFLTHFRSNFNTSFS